MNKNKIMALTAVAMVTFTMQAESILWHFSGKDGQEAPSSIADVSGTYSLARTQFGPSGSYTTQLSQSDSQGSHLWHRSHGDVETVAGASGSVQMYRYELGAGNVTNRYYGVRYSLTDSATVKTLFPTNSAGEILPFTLEIIFKAQPYVAELCNSKKNFYVAAISRNGATSNNSVFRFACVSNGGMQLQCDSRGSGNGDVNNTRCLEEEEFRDGEWHHVALVYSLDETSHTGTMNVYLDHAIKKTCAFTEGKCLKYIESDQAAERSAQLDIGEMSVNYGAGLCVDEVRLTQAAIGIDAFAHAAFETDCKEKVAGTVARWTFDAPGRSGKTVGGVYGAISTVDADAAYGLRGGTHAASSGYWETQLVEGGDFAPVFTNDVPHAYIWDPGTRRIMNPDNATSVFFKHADEDGASAQGFTGSVVNTSSKITETFPSNFTFECFMKCDKSFGKNVSGLFGIFNGSSVNASRYVAIDLPNSTTKTNVRLIESGNDDVVTIRDKAADDGNWHHVAANYDVTSGSSRTIKLWVDYDLTATKTLEGAPTFDPAKVAIAFGAMPDGRAFSGFIDEPRISFGDIGVDRFLRQFTPREDLTGVWLVPTNSVLSGREWHSPDTDYLEGTWGTGDLVLSGNLPCSETFVRTGKGRVKLSHSVAFSGNGGLTIPCAATVGTNVFTVEANFSGSGTVFAKKMFGGKSSWAVTTADDGAVSVEINGVKTSTAVRVDDGKWHHAALVVDRASTQTAKLYIDANEVETVDVSSMTLDSGDFVVGEDFVGNIVGVRFSPGAVPCGRFMIAGPVPGLRFIFR